MSFTQRIDIRLTKVDKDVLQRSAEARGMTYSQYVRLLIRSHANVITSKSL